MSIKRMKVYIFIYLLFDYLFLGRMGVTEERKKNNAAGKVIFPTTNDQSQLYNIATPLLKTTIR